jgi:hypothetical protein
MHQVPPRKMYGSRAKSIREKSKRNRRKKKKKKKRYGEISSIKRLLNGRATNGAMQAIVGLLDVSQSINQSINALT